MIDWAKCPAVESRPGKLGGKWVFKASRVPVETLFANLSAGATVDEYLDWFEGITREQVAEVLAFVAEESQPPTLPDREAEPAAV
jgi:uncharacterized protein (DUF433 family)